ncbi:hypothetical protein DQ04_26331000, partial [Trypanosoma grayi]|uniref:hypothetical protein n=1 Tax=Trypanosoma grayi TaxID=71804 RepID=UPI0004F42892
AIAPLAMPGPKLNMGRACFVGSPAAVFRRSARNICPGVRHASHRLANAIVYWIALPLANQRVTMNKAAVVFRIPMERAAANPQRWRIMGPLCFRAFAGSASALHSRPLPM